MVSSTPPPALPNPEPEAKTAPALPTARFLAQAALHTVSMNFLTRQSMLPMCTGEPRARPSAAVRSSRVAASASLSTGLPPAERTPSARASAIFRVLP